MTKMKFSEAKPGDVLKVKGLMDKFNLFIKTEEKCGLNCVSADTDFRLGTLWPLAEVEKIGIAWIKLTED